MYMQGSAYISEYAQVLQEFYVNATLKIVDFGVADTGCPLPGDWRRWNLPRHNTGLPSFWYLKDLRSNE